MVKSWGVVVVWPRAFYCHLLGLGVLSIPTSQVPSPKSQSQSLDNIIIDTMKNQKNKKVYCQATGTGTWDLGLGTWDLGPGTWDLGPGTWDLGPGT